MREAMFGRYDTDIGGVRIRSRDISRLEGMTDAALGIALALLIVSQDVPNTYPALIAMLWAMPAFGVTFVLIMLIWYWHNRFFRRYGLMNGEVMWLSNLLIFLVLLFVFPLKYLASIVINLWLFNTVLGIGAPFNTEGLTPADAAYVHVIFTMGFAAVCLCFAALYNAALRQQVLLELDKGEVIATKMARLAFFVVAIAGLATSLPALLLPSSIAPVAAGWSLLLIRPIQAIAARLALPRYQREYA